VTYETVEVSQKKPYGIYPDVGVWKAAPGGVAIAEHTTVVTPAVESVVSLEVPLELFSVEIRSVGDEVLVTSLEILSPVNKQRGHDAYLDYLRKRRDLLRSAAHLIEIDLLRAGVRPPLEQAVPPAPYYVMLSRATTRPYVTVWPVSLQSTLPVIPVPLLEPDPDVPLDLGAVVASVYERGGYDARINYQLPVPLPVLSETEANWVEQLLSKFRQATPNNR
jgi:hypothetical protein